jgi:hypothetical protein
LVHRRTIGTDEIVSASQQVSKTNNQVHVTQWLLKWLELLREIELATSAHHRCQPVSDPKFPG